MFDKIQRGHKVKAKDIKKVLETVWHKGKLTVWNQLLMLHSEVFVCLKCFCLDFVTIWLFQVPGIQLTQCYLFKKMKHYPSKMFHNKTLVFVVEHVDQYFQM